MIVQLLVNGLVVGCLYSLVALGYALITNTTRIFHIAHGAVFAVGAYALYWLAIRLSWPLGLAMPLAVAVTALLGAACERCIYAPLWRRGASMLVYFVTSLGLYISAVNVLALVFGDKTQVLRPGIEATFRLGQVVLTRVQAGEVLAFAVLFPGTLLFLRRTGWGRAIRAVRDNSTLASVMGFNLEGLRLSVFAAGSALAGVAGMLYGLDVGIDPHAGMPMLLIAAVAVIIGGVGTFRGAVMGAFVLGLVQSVVVWLLSARWAEAAVFLVLVLFLLFKPRGILGGRRRVEEVAH